MNKKIEDYLHLYLGCDVMFNGKPAQLFSASIWKEAYEVFYDFNAHPCDLHIDELKPLLRPLSSMTEEEMQECGNMVYDFSDEPELNKWTWKDFEIGLATEQFHWLLSKHFDLFGLIESGLAIDKTKQPTP